MRKIAIVSPSGKFYGSEQVLFDFLSQTEHHYSIYLPQGLFFEKIKEQGKHSAYLYSSVALLYIRLAFLLLFNKYDGVYLNEGGHIRYLNLLSDIFRHKHFFVHIRLLEDCDVKRLGRKRKNISYISISEYITHEMMQNAQIQCVTIYDIYRLSSGVSAMRNIELRQNTIRVGVIGRVTTTKGLSAVLHFCDYCEGHGSSYKLEFHFFGGIDSHLTDVSMFIKHAGSYRNIKCVFHGFILDKSKIYNSIDILLHFNSREPLGRILMESLDFGVPFIAFNAGGAGEIACKIGVGDYMIGLGDNWDQILWQQITNLITDKKKTIEAYSKAKEQMTDLCNPELYTQNLEKLFYS